MNEAMLDMLIGQTILGEFKVERVIGSGAFATAYLAKQEHMDRYVVAKITHPHLVEGAMASMVQARFNDEVRAASRVKHPNLVTIYTAGQVMACPTLVMEYVEGTSLERWLIEHAPMEMAQYGQLFMQIASALRSLHQAGIVHRDLSPRNILMSPTPDGGHKAVLLDFGIAQLDGNTKYTMGPLGTPRYMSPEQAQGDSTPESDIYSLGAMLWWAVTGKQYLDHLNSFTDIFKYQLQNPQGPSPRSVNPNVPVPLASMISKMLSMDPFNRPTAQQFMDFWVAFDSQQNAMGRGHLAKTDQYTPLNASAIPAHLAAQNELQQLYIMDTGNAHQLIRQSQKLFQRQTHLIEVGNIWELEVLQSSTNHVSLPLLMCVEQPQTGLMMLKMLRESDMTQYYQPILLIKESSWANQFADLAKEPVFELPKDTSALCAYLSLAESVSPDTKEFVVLPVEESTNGFNTHQNDQLNNSVDLSQDISQSIDWVVVRQHNTSPAQTASYIDKFIGEMPNILAELEMNLTNPKRIVWCCHEIERLARPLGVTQILRLTRMISGLAANELLLDLEGPYEELEQAYTESFQELMQFQRHHTQVNNN